jgi:hypothetical protein
MKMKKLLTGLALAALPAMSYAATCTRADLTGTWLIYAGDGEPTRCVLVMPSTGTAISTQSSCYLPVDKVSAPLRGNLTLKLSNCNVYGTVRTGTDPSMYFDAFIGKGKDSISGMVWRTGIANANDGGSFSGVKQ